MAKDKTTTQDLEPKSRVSVEDLLKYFNLAKSEYATEHRRMQILDLTNRAGLWKALNATFPSYQLLPDTNHVSYIKSNLVASIYTVAKGASLMPTSDKDKQIIEYLNIALDQEWTLAQVGFMQMRAGSNAALHNIGITQVGWGDDLLTTSNTTQNGNVRVKNIHPLKFMRDPYAVSLETAAYCMVFDNYHKSVIQSNKNYKEEFERYLNSGKSTGSTLSIPNLADAKVATASNDYYTIVTFWVRVYDEKTKMYAIDEIHTVNAEHILYVRKNIKPNKFPFAILYCNDPEDSLVGVSEPAKGFANSVVYNILDSIIATAIYKNQRPPKYVSVDSGLNIRAFAEHADDPDYTFIVNGDATKAAHYHQYPQVDNAVTALKTTLQMGLQNVSGVDARYTGRDTGSILTTGGTQEMLGRVTVIDTPKILNFEEYTKQLTQLVLSNLVEFAEKREYFEPIPGKVDEYKTVSVDFPDIDSSTVFKYQINISSLLPKNKARIAEMANQLVEKQMQYKQAGMEVDLITPEEWLMFQDIPNKEYMLERMGMQRLNSSLEDVSQVLFEYAELTKNGVPPQDALMAVAESLKRKRSGSKDKADQKETVDPLTEAAGPMLAPDTSMPEY